MLNKEHQYFFQMQLQMYATNRKYCDFFVWCKQFYYLERINKDENFLKLNIQKALNFHKQVIKPELLARWYTNPQTSSIQEAQGIENDKFCYCEASSDDELIFCSNDDCEIKLFHLGCIDVLECNDLFWYCESCRYM